MQFENGMSEIPLKFLGLLLRVGAQRTAEIDSECHWAESVIILQNIGLDIYISVCIGIGTAVYSKVPTNITSNGNVSAVGSSNLILCNRKEQEICTSHNFT